MEIPKSQFDLLVDQVRELTARVHRLEILLRVSPPEAASPPVVVPAKMDAPRPPVQTPEVARPAPPPPAFAVPSETVDRTDLEARIGSHWLNRIGIAAVLIGVSYFLKYAFDNGWIGPAGRVTIGLIAGIAVVLWSERFRSCGYRIFSYSLKAVGIGVLYLSLWAAFQVYQLIPSGVAFFCMLVVTASTCALALTQDAEILAAFAITGGFPPLSCSQPE